MPVLDGVRVVVPVCDAVGVWVPVTDAVFEAVGVPVDEVVAV